MIKGRSSLHNLNRKRWVKMATIQTFLEESLHTSFTINLTNRCNLDCSYCLRDCGPKKEGSLSFTAVKNILRYFSLMNEKGLPMIVIFTGGEPFLHPEADMVFKTAVDLGYTVRIQTNGTILPSVARRYPWIFEHPKFVFKISIDGWNEETNDVYRGEGTFRKIIAGLEVLKTSGSTFGLKSVVHPGNFPEIYKMLDFCREWGARGWTHNILMAKGRSKIDADISEIDVLNKLIPFYNQGQYKPLLNGSNALIYYVFGKQGRKVWPPYIYFHFDGSVYITDTTIPNRELGRICLGTAEELKNVIATEEKILSAIDRPISYDIVKFVQQYLKI